MGSLVYLNYLYFIILTTFGLLFAFGRSVVVKNPLHREQRIRFDGGEAFWILTFSTGLLAFNVSGIIDLMAIRLFVLELLFLIALKISKMEPIWSIPVFIYILYIIWLVFGCTYTTSFNYGFRTTLKYLYPILIILVASAIVRDNETAATASLWSRRLALFAIIVFFVPKLSDVVFPNVFWYETAAAIHFIAICTFSLAAFYHGGKDKKDLFLSLLFMIPCLVWVFRTSIMGTALALMTFFLFRYKIKSVPIIFVIVIAFIASIFFIPSVKEKMFNKSDKMDIESLQSGKISKDDIDSNGRFAMWEWSLKRYYDNKEIIGSGTGNLQKVFYTTKHPFLPIRICHNDYVQILCDNGLIGLFLFGASFLALIIHCFFIYQKEEYSIMLRICAITAGSSAAGMLLTMYTDNVVNYSMATLSMPCGFYGMTLGLLHKQQTSYAV